MPHDKDSGAQPAGPCALVIFGAAGDLTKRLVIPALYNLARAQLLPEEFVIVGFDLADHSDGDWRNSLAGMVEQFANAGDSKSAFDRDAWNFLASRMSYMKGDLTKPESYQQLRSKLEEADNNRHTGGNYLFYLAVADRFFGTVVEQLGKSCLSCETHDHWRRIVIEKPFGHDLQSAQDLDHKILDIVRERQIYRIDHFLGKETVQNLTMF